MCLVATAKDKRLEQFWRKCEGNDAWRHIRRFSFEFVTSTTCSVWEIQPRFDQIYNQERNLASYDFLTELGIPTIPFVFAARPEDYRAAARWIEERGVSVLAALGQFYRDQNSFRLLTNHMALLQDCVSYQLRFVVVGCATSRKIKELFTRYPQSVIICSKPIMEGISGRETDRDLTHRPAQHVSRDALVIRNILRFYQFCESLAA